MPQSYTPDRARKPGWIMPVVVVASVSAVSLALGLGVVGPMIQRRMETPPPALSTSGTTSALPVRLSAPPADVEIKERVIRRPTPKPAPLTGTDSPADSSQTLTPDATSAAPGDTAGSPAPAKPTIHATVTDAGLDAGPDGTPVEPSAAAASRAKRPAASPDGSEAGGTGNTSEADTAQDAGPHARGAGVPKAHGRRVSPLEALPPLNAAGTGTAGEDQGPRTVVPPAPDAVKSGRAYRVQVGRFDDEAAAQRLRDELAKSGLSPRVVKSERGGATVYRVQVGTFSHKENADRAMDKLKAQSYEPYLAEDEP